MQVSSSPFPAWLIAWFQGQGVSLWGAADLRGFSSPEYARGRRFPRGLSWAIPMDPRIMAEIRRGPNQRYADEYARVNARIDDLAAALVTEIQGRGFPAKALAASRRTDAIHFAGDFPHKTAATRAGLGWIGRHCQLITRNFGPWIRLGTVFTTADLPCGPPKERNFCGKCTRCIDACPAAALKGKAWVPGVSRDEILDAHACDRWKKEHYSQYHKGHNCGICSAVCPYGLKILRRGKSS